MLAVEPLPPESFRSDDDSLVLWLFVASLTIADSAPATSTAALLVHSSTTVGSLDLLSALPMLFAMCSETRFAEGEASDIQ